MGPEANRYLAATTDTTVTKRFCGNRGLQLTSNLSNRLKPCTWNRSSNT